MPKKQPKTNVPFGQLLVSDLNARGGGSRVHTMVNQDGEIEEIELSLKPTPVDEFVARQFAAADDAFHVTTPEGTPVRPMVAESESGHMVLEEGQVVAHLEELTLPALLSRANRLVGGESLRQSHGKKRVLEFLLAQDATDPPVIEKAATTETTKTPPAAPVQPRGGIKTVDELMEEGKSAGVMGAVMSTVPSDDLSEAGGE